MKRTPTIQKTDLRAITPQRLQGKIDYSVFNEFIDFQHRGTRCQVDTLLSYLGAAIDSEAISRGSDSTPVTLSEHDAVDIVTEALASKHPSWFGAPDALEDLNEPVSDIHLSESQLREAYWQQQVRPVTSPVKGDSWSDQKRVIIPLVGIVLQTLRDQRQADAATATESAQAQIKQTVVREAYENDLSDHEIQQAVHEALDTLPV